MFDTVQLRRQFPLPSSMELEGRGFRRLWGDSKRWVWDASVIGKTLPRLTWRSTQGRDWLTAEVSIPKMLYSNNVFSVTADDVQKGMKLVSQFASDVAGVT